MSEWFRDGLRVDAFPAGDRGMLYGDGLFETIAVRDGQARLWDLHVERLRSSCERLQIEVPDESRLQSALGSALAATSFAETNLTAKLLLSTGVSPRGYRRAAEADTSLLVAIDAASRLDVHAYRQGIQVRVCNTRLAIQPRLAGIKSLNRLEQVLARQEWAGPVPWEGLMFDTEGKLICGTMSNVFIVRDNQYLTPRLDGAGVAGIMRRHVLNVLSVNGSECAETTLSEADLVNADEVFLTNSQVGVVPVARVDQLEFQRGPATRRIQELLSSAFVPECDP